MTTSELIAASYLKASGKVSTLSTTDAKYIKIRDIANGLIDSWQNENDVDWNSLYDPEYVIGTITATNSFDLDTDTIRKISDSRGDYVRIVWTDGVNYTDYDVVTPDTLKRYDASATVCAQVGATLKFNKTFATTDSEYGGSIKVPVYLYAETLSGASDTVPVDIARWLVIMTAAEFVRNDITKQNQYPNLVNEANQLMQRMKDDNEAQVSEVHIPFHAAGADW